VSLSEFFDDDGTVVKSKKQDIKKKQSTKREEIEPVLTKDTSSVEPPPAFTLGQDINNVFLLDVLYERGENLAQCLFYHEGTRSIYKWNDTSGHKPYLLTLMSPDTIQQIDSIVKSKEFERMETVEKHLLIEDQQQVLTKVYGSNPLAIGGKPTSFREFVDPAYEADIRYHFNYVADKGITPATYYNVKEGKLVATARSIDPDIKDKLYQEFSNEIQEQLDMLNEYMPLLFQDIPDIFRCAFDIEVGSERGRLPNPNNPKDPIISIAVVDNDGKQICWVLNTDVVSQEASIDGVLLRRFDSERLLLEDFFDELSRYPIVLSFNGDNFDCPYLINRARRLEIKNSDMPFQQKRNEVSLKDSVHIDLYRFFRQAAIRIYAFSGRYDSASLDELSLSLLNEGKLPIDDDVWINEMGLTSLVTYNVKDAELTLRLTQFDDNVVLKLMFILIRICKMPLFDFSRTAVSGWLQMWLVHEHRKRDYLIPRKQDILDAKGATATSDAIIEGKKFQGAIVLDPTPGIWWDVHVLDFASLYPSIIKTRNLSYETIRCDHQECRSNVVPEVGHWSCTKRHGMFAIILGFIRDTRVKWFKPRSDDVTLNEVERRNNQVIQSSLKVLINAGYGVFGSTAFDFYCPPVAESTTAYARDAIKATQAFVENELGVRVLYGDTDSVFLYQPNAEQIAMLMEWGNQYIGIELGTDYEFRYVVFSDRKKNYFGVTKRGGTIVKGLMGKKSNTPQIVRDNFTRVLNLLKSVKKPEDFDYAKLQIKKLLQSMIAQLETGDFSVEDASIRMTLSRRLREYETWTQSIQAIAQLIESGDIDSSTITIGDVVEFVKVSSPIRVMIPKNSGLAFPPEERSASVIPIQLVNPEKDLDGKPIIDVAESTFSQLLNSLDMSWDSIMGVQSLDEFF
jgi:DNA polymerase I